MLFWSTTFEHFTTKDFHQKNVSRLLNRKALAIAAKQIEHEEEKKQTQKKGKKYLEEKKEEELRTTRESSENKMK